MKFKDVKKRLLDTNPEFRAAYHSTDRALELSHLIVRERVRRGLTQEELANRMGTQQPSIARAEAGTVLPSIQFLDKVARALSTSLSVEFKEVETYNVSWQPPKNADKSILSAYYRMGPVPLTADSSQDSAIENISGPRLHKSA